MKLAAVADLHIYNHRAHGGAAVAGLNTRCRMSVQVLRAAVKRAHALGCEAIYLLGDVFDGVRPEPQVIAAVQEALEGLPAVLLEGNHDMVSMTAGDHSLGPFSASQYVIDKPTAWVEKDGLQVLAVPFEPGPASEWLPRRVRELSTNKHSGATVVRRLLVTHVGISGHDTPAFMKAVHDQVPAYLLGEVCRENHIDLVLAGNWHSHRTFELTTPRHAKAVQVGALCPTGWDNPGPDYGTMVVWDSMTGAMTVEVLPGPRFLNVAAETAVQGQLGVDMAKLEGCWLFARARVDQPRLGLVQAQLQHLKDKKVLEGFEVELEDAEVRAQARTAATVARSAETLDSALTGFVQQMPLPDGVDRATVLEKAKGFLAGG